MAVHFFLLPDPGPETPLHHANPAPAETPPLRPGARRPLRRDPESLPPSHHHLPVHDSPLHPEPAALHTNHHRRFFCHTLTCRLTVLAEDRILAGWDVPGIIKSRGSHVSTKNV